MAWLSELGRRLLMLLRRKQFGRDLEEEMRLHLELREQEQIEGGLSSDEARYAARRRFGNTMLLKEVSREIWGWDSFEHLIQDVRYGLRTMLRSPGFTAVAVITLALGIGANTAMFSVLNAVLIRPLPYPNPGRLVRGGEIDKRHDSKPGQVSWPNFSDWRDQNTVFERLAAWYYEAFNLTGWGEPQQVQGAIVSPDFFETLGVAPQKGTTLLSDQNGSSVVLSHRLYVEHFGSARDLLESPSRSRAAVTPSLALCQQVLTFPPTPHSGYPSSAHAARLRSAARTNSMP